MSLKTFHIVFILSALVLSFGLAVWEIQNAVSRNTPDFWIGISSFAGGILLCGYLLWFLKAMRDPR